MAFYAFIVFSFVLIIIVRTYHLRNIDLNDGGGWVRRRELVTRRLMAPAWFRPMELTRRFEERGMRLEQLRSEGGVGVRPPRLAQIETARVGEARSDTSSAFVIGSRQQVSAQTEP